MDPFGLQHLFDEELKRKDDWKKMYIARRPDLQVPLKIDNDFECTKMVVISLGAGYLMGGILALFMNSGETAINDTTLSQKTQTKVYFRYIGSRIHRQGKSFGIFGALIFSYQCPLESIRGKKDSINGLIGGACAGAMMAVARRASIKGVLTGALGTSLFIGVFDFLMSDNIH